MAQMNWGIYVAKRNGAFVMVPINMASTYGKKEWSVCDDPNEYGICIWHLHLAKRNGEFVVILINMASTCCKKECRGSQ